MQMLVVVAALVSVMLAGVAPEQAAGARSPVPIFDGKTFTGWEGDLKVFRIENGAIVGGTLQQKIARNEFLCTTRAYSDFELRLKVKLLGGEDANAGVQFRTRRITGNHEVIGYQADLGQNYWGSLYDESRRKKTLAGPKPDTLKGLIKIGDWNDYVVRAEGRRIRLWLNGVQTVDYTEQDPAIDTSGVIAVQIHAGSPTEAWYKDITLLDLAR
jgi:3-keto-disaccharide hydrolase